MSTSTEVSLETTPFALTKNPQPRGVQERNAILADPGFGIHFTDHLVAIDWSAEKGWHDARVEPYGPIELDPAAAVFHYAQEIFEGLKAYRHDDGSVWTFRPEANADRFARSAQRLALPVLPRELFLQSIQELLAVDHEWVPAGEGEKSLYLRPFMIATESFLGVRPARSVSFRLIASPAGAYFSGGVKPVKIWISDHYARSGPGGTGAAKCGGNYAASLAAQIEADEKGCDQVCFLDAKENTYVEELGGMNVFFVFRDGSLVTPELTGTILEGVTRSSILRLAKDLGLKPVERKISFDEVQQGIQSGEISEVFSCGTAAVITPIGEFHSSRGQLGDSENWQGEVTMKLRQELLGIQYGRIEDRYQSTTKIYDPAV